MRVAVLSLTRDRLWSTQHCFTRLRDLAGCDYDHVILDQGSQDGTLDWLRDHYRPFMVVGLGENIGVSRGINTLLDGLDLDRYDVVVKFDNDCELTVDGTLKVACETVMSHPNWILSPHILGLNSPPSVSREEIVDGHLVGVVGLIGGIFMAAPASLYRDGYRHDPANPVWGMDDANLGAHWQREGGSLGYLLDHPAWHYLGTEGQRAQDPSYFARKDAEYTG